MSQAIPAFSGADGAARTVSGGRGGIVYHVTKLNSAIDDPQRNDFGTIRYGLNNSNFPAGVPRTIVFDVGGVFHLGRLPQPDIGWDPNGNGWDAQSRLTIGGTNITIAGQTAPGPGVIFMGGGLKPQGNNNIIRNITVASGYGLTGWWKPGDPFPATPGTAGAGTDASKWYPDNVVYDAMDISGTNLMIDHVSTLYATDETISMNEVAKNITVQYSNISQGQNFPQWDAEGGGLTGHALGSLLEAGNSTSAAISFHHNLYAHQKSRVPQTQAGSSGGGYYDFRNNVFYNWLGTAGNKSGNTFWNLINNFYLAGDGGDNPAGGSNPAINNASGGTGVINASSTIHRRGNIIDSNKDADANDGVAVPDGGAGSLIWAGGVATYVGVTDTATQSFQRVLDYVGARWWTRDGIIDTPDERIIHEARTGTGKIIAWADDPFNSNPNEGTEWRALLNTPAVYRDANFDTDQDGIPNAWEIAHGLDPNSPSNNGDFDNDGYTNLEEYINEIAEWPAPRPIVFNGATNNRYAQITNWDITWQPSKYDTARIVNGTAVVDAVGQHAGTLLVGDGGNGTLSISGGWIKVHTLLRVRETGKLQITGGQLDITGGAAIFDYSAESPHEQLLSLIASAFNNGNWDGVGITSSHAADMPWTGIGIAEAAALGLSSFEGQAVDATTVLLRYTWLGDANLDRIVDISDLAALAANFNGAGGWTEGDFNYDGVIDAMDLALLAFNWQAGNFNEALMSLGISGADVPEPASGGLLALGAFVLSQRRRRF